MMIERHTKRQLGQLLINLRYVLFVAAIVALVGCGSAPKDDGPAKTAVSGQVTYNGTPVADASVTFHPVANSNGSAASGLTDAQGQFKMGTGAAGDGVVPGDYDVTVTKMESADSGSQASEDDPNYDPDAGQDAAPKNALPQKYADPSTSGLSASVMADQPVSDLKFELAD